MITGERLTKRFGAFTALDEISFNIKDGAIFGLVGSNGSGKSTLLRLISGIYMPDGGMVGIDGVPTFNNPELKSQISFLGDTPYFLPQASLNEMRSFYKGIYPNFSDETYKYLLGVFPLDAKARISSMSKGMQRQAALILSLSASPRYLLMDEAFDGLDVVMRRVLANLIIEGMENRGMTTVIASHNLRELEDLSDHIGLLHNGKIIFNGGTEGMKKNIHKVQAVFKSVPDVSAFSALDIVKCERTGSVLQMVVRGEEEEILSFINKLSPIFVECIEPTLEEIFIYELEVTGYDVKNILSE